MINSNPVKQWLSWQSGRFRYQKPAVQKQSRAKFYMCRTRLLLTVEKTKIKKKEPGNSPFKENDSLISFSRKSFYESRSRNP